MAYRSHVQQELVLETLDGELLCDVRLLADRRLGTSELMSDLLSSSDSDRMDSGEREMRCTA
jgi:hypothetical protein